MKTFGRSRPIICFTQSRAMLAIEFPKDPPALLVHFRAEQKTHMLAGERVILLNPRRNGAIDIAWWA